MTERDRRARLAGAVPWLRRAYLAALCAAIIWLADAHWSRAVEVLEGARPAPIAASLLLSFCLLGLTSAIWSSSLRMLGHHMPITEIATAIARSLPARYVPMGVTLAAARVALLRSAGAPLAPLTATAALEMATGASLALSAGLAVLGAVGALPGGLAWTAVAVLAAGAIIAPAAGLRTVARLVERRGVVLAMSWSGYVRVLGAALAYWLCNSAAFVLYLRAFPSADGIGSLEAAGAFMVAWAVGFLTVLAPQGLGVAELGLAALLADGTEGGIAMSVVFAGYRLVHLARDLVTSLAAEIIATRRVRRGSEPTG